MKALMVFLSLLALLLMAETAFACSCVRVPTISESFREADAVFLGTVVDIDADDITEVKFKVEKSWKGVHVDEAILFSFGTSCDSWFKVGEKYVVYGSKWPGGEYSAGACTKTAHVSEASEQLAYLQNKPLIPLTSAPKDYRGIVLVTGLFVLLFVGIGLILRRISRCTA